MVKNPPSNAEDTGSIPGWGTKVPHAMGQLSLCTTTRESPCATKTQCSQEKEKGRKYCGNTADETS